MSLMIKNLLIRLDHRFINMAARQYLKNRLIINFGYTFLIEVTCHHH